jgi:hypothetical protein
MVGTTISHYQVLRKLGSGGMAMLAPWHVVHTMTQAEPLDFCGRVIIGSMMESRPVEPSNARR